MEEKREVHPWKWRLIIGLIMLLLAFGGVAITMLKKESAWDYWRILSCVFALLSLGLSLYLRRHKWHSSTASIWQEVLHWVGFILSISLLSVSVKMGLLTSFAASLQAVNLLFLSTFLAGIYIEKTFLLIGFFLGGFVLILSYSLLLIIPVVLVGAIGVFWFVKKKKHQIEEFKE